jgi:hypothetical protein
VSSPAINYRLRVTQLNGCAEALDEVTTYVMTLAELQAKPPSGWEDDTDDLEVMSEGETLRFGRRWKVTRLADGAVRS